MPPASSCFTAINVPEECIPEWMGSFSLSAPPNTDLWRKPPRRDTTTAPVLYTALENPFIAAEVTVSADWELEWDQGGLVIYAGPPPGRGSNASSAAERTQEPAQEAAAHPANHEPPPAYRPPAPVAKWVKVGLEFVNNSCNATSVVAGSDGADWSVTALPPHHARRNDLRVKLERIGYALWLYYEDDTAGWKKLREVYRPLDRPSLGSFAGLTFFAGDVVLLGRRGQVSQDRCLCLSAGQLRALAVQSTPWHRERRSATPLRRFRGPGDLLMSVPSISRCWQSWLAPTTPLLSQTL
jgi:regulation of enolase protein 1 (concanavalin A-like superfamily)